MMRRLASSSLVGLLLAAPALLAQDTRAVTPAEKLISAKPWPPDDVLLARSTDAQNRKLFQDGPPLEFTLTSEFNQINRERTPNNARLFAGVLTIDGADIPVKLGSRGHLRLNSKTCDFVPLKTGVDQEDVCRWLSRHASAGMTFTRI